MTQDRPDAPELLDALAEFLFCRCPRVGAAREALPGPGGREPLRDPGPGAACRTEPMRDDLALLLELSGTEPPVGELSGAELREAVRAAEAELARCLRAGELDESLDESPPACASTSAASSSRSPRVRGLSARGRVR